jgi:2-amino-4-hydroxy-6-hydroxymethyldihydropteridine diphosphokinase
MDSLRILRSACAALGERLRGLRVSPVYRTAPLFFTAQGDFLNLVCAGDWEGDAEGLLGFVQAVEAAFGRDRAGEIPKGPRTLDIDIALFGNEVISTEDLRVPHPGITGRAFVLVPLLELFPSARDPVSGKSYKSFLDCLPRDGVEWYAHGTGI